MFDQLGVDIFTRFLLGVPPYVFALIAVWELAWKSFALWRAARNNQRYWFIALVLLNTLGILPIIYIFFISKRK